MTAPAIPSHPCADNPAYAICSPCCNVPRRCRQTLPRPAPASGPWCRVCPQGARTHLPGRAVWPISGDGSCRTCHAVYGMSMSDHDRSYDRGGTRCTCCRQGLLPADTPAVLTPSGSQALSPSGPVSRFLSPYACILARKVVPL